MTASRVAAMKGGAPENIPYTIAANAARYPVFSVAGARQICSGARYSAGLRSSDARARACRGPGHLHVHELDPAVGEDHHVSGAEPAADGPTLCKASTASPRPTAQRLPCPVCRGPARAHDVAQQAALDELHDSEGLTGLGLLELQDSDEPRVAPDAAAIDRPMFWTARTTPGEAASSRGRNRIATRCVVASSSAAYTVPSPPDPSSRRSGTDREG
jgi:hypothetical protein